MGQKEEYTFYRDYIDDERGAKAEEFYHEHMTQVKREVVAKLEKLKTLANKKGMKKTIVNKLLLNLRYLTKLVSFKEEQECRILKILPFKDEKVKVSKDKKHLYIDNIPIRNFVSKICFAPDFSDIALHKDWLKKAGLVDIDSNTSDNPFVV